MSLLETYLQDEEVTIPMLCKTLDAHMGVIKQEAESLGYMHLTDEAFEYQIASLCLCVEKFKAQVIEAEAGMSRFEQNTYRKWQTYTDSQQDIVRLLTAKTVEQITRIQKMERSSSFNVIKVNSHYIEVEYKNKALVPPSSGKPSTTTTTPTTQPALEIFQSQASIAIVVSKTTEIVERFIEMQNRMRVYLAHYSYLGNLASLKSEHLILKSKMDIVASYVDETVLIQSGGGTSYKDIIRESINQVDVCFTEMQETLAIERNNYRVHVNNTVDRFIEHSTTYQKLLAHLRAHNIEVECLRKEGDGTGEERNENEVYCSSMYQRGDETI